MRCLLDGIDHDRADESRDGGADENGDGILGHVPEKSNHDAGKDGVGKRIPDQGHLAHHDEAPEQPATDAEQNRSKERIPDGRILESEKPHGLLPDGTLRQVANPRGVSGHGAEKIEDSG
jgi:hypothetical protein